MVAGELVVVDISATVVQVDLLGGNWLDVVVNAVDVVVVAVECLNDEDFVECCWRVWLVSWLMLQLVVAILLFDALLDVSSKGFAGPLVLSVWE